MILPARLSGLGSTSHYAATVTALAPTYGVPPSLALAVMNQESGGNQFTASGGTLTNSTSGALGLFQLMPTTAAGLGVNPNDPTQNITGGLKYLQQMYQVTGNWNDALVAYNEGPGAFAAHGAYPGAAQYASSILAAANLDSSTSTDSTLPDLTDYSASDSTDTSGDTSGGSGLSGTTMALIAAGVVGLAILATR